MVGSNSTLAARRRRFGAAHSSGPDTSLVEAERTRSASLHVDYVVLVRTPPEVRYVLLSDVCVNGDCATSSAASLLYRCTSSACGQNSARSLSNNFRSLFRITLGEKHPISFLKFRWLCSQVQSNSPLNWQPVKFSRARMRYSCDL